MFQTPLTHTHSVPRRQQMMCHFIIIMVLLPSTFGQNLQCIQTDIYNSSSKIFMRNYFPSNTPHCHFVNSLFSFVDMQLSLHNLNIAQNMQDGRNVKISNLNHVNKCALVEGFFTRFSPLVFTLQHTTFFMYFFVPFFKAFTYCLIFLGGAKLSKTFSSHSAVFCPN